MLSPCEPEPDEIVMIRPHPRSHMGSMVALTQLRTPYKFTSMYGAHSALGSSRNCTGRMLGGMPALLTRMSMPSLPELARSTAAGSVTLNARDRAPATSAPYVSLATNG